MSILLYLPSFICYILSFFYNSIALFVLSIPFLLLLCAIVHELGHCLGCYINSNKITIIVTPLFEYKNGKISIVDTLIPESYCSFVKSENNSLVYILGPIISFLFALLTGVLYILFKRISIAVLVMVAVIAFLINIIPGKNGDLKKFHNEKK